MTDVVEVIDPSETTTVDDPTPSVTVEITDTDTGTAVTEVIDVNTDVELTEVELETVEIAPDSVVEVDVSEFGEPGPKGDPGVGIQGVPGQQGDRGAPGPAGPGANYVHTQNDPQATWVIVHNLGFHPAVTVVDSGGTTVEGSVWYVDNDTVEVAFTSAFGGNAYLS